MDFSYFFDKEFDCVCGKKHRTVVKDIVVEPNCLDNAYEILKRNNLDCDCLLICDDNTYKAAGEKLYNILKKNINVDVCILSNSWFLHPNERAIGTVMLNIKENHGLLISVGSGSITDTTRFCANISNRKFAAVATAASMDGYLSSIVPITEGYVKLSYKGNPPLLVIADTSVLEKAPQRLTNAGIGDVLGKYLSISDWKLADLLIDESICQVAVDNTIKAADITLEGVKSYKESKQKSVGLVLDGLLLSGIMMQYYDNSRPASGSEHHISHFLETIDNMKNKEGTLHGEKVGVGFFVLVKCYEKFFAGEVKKFKRTRTEAEYVETFIEKFGSAAEHILSTLDEVYYDDEKTNHIIDALEKNWSKCREITKELVKKSQESYKAFQSIGGITSPKELGYSAEEFRDALTYARSIRTRFTILQLIDNMGYLDEYVDDLVEEYYK